MYTIKTRRAILLLPFVFAASANAGELVTNCLSKFVAESPVYLSQSYQQFDQTPTSGWRSLFESGCPSEARDAILDYLTSRDNLSARQISSLYLHAAQMELTLERKRQATQFLNQSLRTNEAPDDPFKFNDYIKALIAYTNHDEPAFDAHFAILNANVDDFGNKQNARFLGVLKAHFLDSYAVAVEAVAKVIAAEAKTNASESVSK